MRFWNFSFRFSLIRRFNSLRFRTRLPHLSQVPLAYALFGTTLLISSVSNGAIQIKKVSIGSRHSACALVSEMGSNDQKVYCWGDGVIGSRSGGVKGFLSEGESIVDFSTNADSTCVLTASNKIMCAENGNFGSFCRKILPIYDEKNLNITTPFRKLNQSDMQFSLSHKDEVFTQLFSHPGGQSGRNGYGQHCASTNKGRVICWGVVFGKDGTIYSFGKPIRDFRFRDHLSWDICATLDDGTVKCYRHFTPNAHPGLSRYEPYELPGNPPKKEDKHNLPEGPFVSWGTNDLKASQAHLASLKTQKLSNRYDIPNRHEKEWYYDMGFDLSGSASEMKFEKPVISTHLLDQFALAFLMEDGSVKIANHYRLSSEKPEFFTPKTKGTFAGFTFSPWYQTYFSIPSSWDGPTRISQFTSTLVDIKSSKYTIKHLWPHHRKGICFGLQSDTEFSVRCVSHEAIDALIFGESGTIKNQGVTEWLDNFAVEPFTLPVKQLVFNENSELGCVLLSNQALKCWGDNFWRTVKGTEEDNIPLDKSLEFFNPLEML